MNPAQNASKESALYIIATPIGNLKDITYRAVETLNMVDKIICEDSRVSQKLLQHYGIKKDLIIYNDHSNASCRERILQQLHAGQQFALISDAGTPLISDPGYKLINAAIAEGITVHSIPGACAPIVALTLSGLASDKFLFAGFLGHSKGQRCQQFKDMQQLDATLIFFTTPKRLTETLQDAQDILGDRLACITREATKLHEEVMRDKLSNLIIKCAAHTHLKGEVVLLISGKQAEEKLDEAQIKELALNLLANMSIKDVVQEISSTYDLPKKYLYSLCLQLLGR